MRLVPTFASVLSMNNKTKFASCLAGQSALAAGLASAITREMSTNLLIDKKDPSTGKSLRDILMALSPLENPEINYCIRSTNCINRTTSYKSNFAQKTPLKRTT
jgi:hypothetical protein